MSSQPAAKANSNSTEDRIKELGIEIPVVSAPAAAYVPYTISGNIVYISGQLPMKDGKAFKTGLLGKNVSVEEGQQTARVCGLNILGHLKNACEGNLDKVKKVLKLEILVASTPEFTEPHVVANGASQLILDVFGKERGSHARVAYGVATLPLGVAVEVAATFEI